MAANNHIGIVGRLGDYPELQPYGDGKSRLQISVGVSDSWDKEHTDWFTCVFFGKRAETVAKYFTRGSEIAITGRIKFEEYNGKWYTKLVAEDFSFTGGSKMDDEPRANVEKKSSKKKTTRRKKTTKKAEPAEDDFVDDDFDDDIPF